VRYATIVRRIGEDATPEGGECGPCADFALYTLAFALQLRKNHGKLQPGYPKGARLISAEYHSFSRLRHRLAMASTSLLPPPPLAFASGDGDQPSVSVRMCRVAELGGSLRQL